ncbi:putative nudix hydrolase YeaB [Winogradskyella psychrotolerans RS-3]|uniref:Putative nudix hydrolase YeaB n=1 Tax=Winogradskyella psychrotolerans RS-3 TaxID=641526 RepID=S7WVE1_9FLAO|nr:CoA pyrophosphatase [Winogradskyella psychrotolerans]EPR70689.1 putative nudix hydrolase YeaB [Winogradskyella psychrotolerans RS-3]
MLFNTFLESVVKIKHLELSGEDSHAKMSPPYRLDLAKKMKEKSKTARKAGVMALFYPNTNDETYLVLILRKTYKGVHSAQVGFPGGKYEDEDDNDLMVTAIRETEEEIGVNPLHIDVLKKMSPLYIPPSNFMVHPYIGISKEYLIFTKQDEEVEAIIEVSLSDFLSDNKMLNTRVPTSFNEEVDVPAFKFNGHIVWGATAMMLGEIKDLLKQVL